MYTIYPIFLKNVRCGSCHPMSQSGSVLSMSLSQTHQWVHQHIWPRDYLVQTGRLMFRPCHKKGAATSCLKRVNAPSKRPTITSLITAISMA